MRPATWPRDDRLAERLLYVDPAATRFADAHVRDLPGYLRRGDLLVLNDAATLPASFRALAPCGAEIEVRLLRHLGDSRFTAVLLGGGDWHTPTEHRPAPAQLLVDDVLGFDPRLTASITKLHGLSPRLIDVRFGLDGAALWSALYRLGRPVQYSYLKGPLDLWSVQNHYASRPWAMELPSAGRPLTHGLLVAIEQRGVEVATLTHAAGLSATGDAEIDRALPLPERYEIPRSTALAVEARRQRGGRIIAVGTTVVRALEGSAAQNHGRVKAGEGETDLRLDEGFRREIVDGLFTGLHEPTASHFSLLKAFVAGPLLKAAYDHASSMGYLGHEFGDSNLILPS